MADHRDPRVAGVRGSACGMHPAAARPHGGNELLHSRRAGGHRYVRSPGIRAARRCCGSTCSGSSAIPRFTSPFCREWAWRRTCSPLLRASRCSVTGPWSAHVRHRLPRLLRVGPPHVHQRHEPLFGIRLFAADHDDRGALGDQDLQLAGNFVGREDSLHHCDAVCARLRFAVRHRRPFRPVPGAALARSLPARHLLRRGAFPLDHGCRGNLRNFCRRLISGIRRCSAGC